MALLMKITRLKRKDRCNKGFIFINVIDNRSDQKVLATGVLNRISYIHVYVYVYVYVYAYEENRILRSFRIGSNFEVLNREKFYSTVDRNNYWRKQERERAGAKKTKLEMKDHYIDVLLSLK